MPRPPAYGDECVQRPVVEALRQLGFDIASALEEGHGQEPDEAQLEHAASLNRVLLSFNRRDFRRLHRDWSALGRLHAGIVLLPQTGPVVRRALRIAMLLDWVGSEPAPRAGGLFEWNDLQLRLHAGIRFPGYTEQQVEEVLGRN